MSLIGFHDFVDTWMLRWRDQSDLVHFSDGVVTRCRMEIPYEDLRHGTSWTPTGMRQDVITCIRCLGWTHRP